MSAVLEDRASRVTTLTPATDLVVAVRPRGKWAARLRSWNWLGMLSVLVVLAAWEVLSQTGLLPAATIPAASSVLTSLVALLTQLTYWGAIGNTLASAVTGLVVVIAIASPLALIVGLSPFIRDSTSTVIEFLKPIPPVAMIPLGLLLWGPSETMKVTLVAFGALWPFFTQLVYGIRQIDLVTLDVAKSYRLSRWTIISRIIAPSVFPYAATGLRVSASIAVVIAVVTELIGGAAGLGRDIVIAQSAGNLSVMYALIITAGVLGLLINALFSITERRLLFWHASQRKESQ